MEEQKTLRFKTIGLIGKHGDDRVKDAINDLCHYLNGKGCETVIDSATAEVMNDLDFPIVTRKELGERADLCIIVGGDGTLLNAARSLTQFDLPLLGFNLGRLGFLTDIAPEDMVENPEEPPQEEAL